MATSLYDQDIVMLVFVTCSFLVNVNTGGVTSSKEIPISIKCKQEYFILADEGLKIVYWLDLWSWRASIIGVIESK